MTRAVLAPDTFTRPIQHDAHVRAAIMSPDVVLPSASLARIGLADSSEHELDMVSWRDVAAEWDLDRETAEKLLDEARAGLEPLQPPPPPRRRAALAHDLFTRPYADLDDVQARIGAAVAFIVDRTAGKAVPEALDAEITFARGTLDDLAAIRGPKARARAFRAEHGPLLGLTIVTSAEAAR